MVKRLAMDPRIEIQLLRIMTIPAVNRRQPLLVREILNIRIGMTGRTLHSPVNRIGKNFRIYIQRNFLIPAGRENFLIRMTFQANFIVYRIKKAQREKS
jgi:hypothetical protein